MLIDQFSRNSVLRACYSFCISKTTCHKQ